MPIITIETKIGAPVERVFDLARSIDLHQESMNGSGERAIDGVTSGLIGMGESVTWEARHFGIRQRLTSKIVVFDRPRHFRDSMVSGAFKRFDHDHFFEAEGDGALMTDIFDYDAPLGMLGKLADLLFLERYMKRLLVERNQVIKKTAERSDWGRFVGGETPPRPLRKT